MGKQRRDTGSRSRFLVVLAMLVALALAGLGLAGCGDDGDGDSDTGSGSTSTEEDEEDDQEEADEEDEEEAEEDENKKADEDEDEDSSTTVGEDLSKDNPSSSDGGIWAAPASAYADEGTAEVTIECTPDGEPGSVWGTGTYTDDSSVCTAAVHAGFITLDEGGEVTFMLTPGEESYEGTVANGITSSDYGSWLGSFVFTGQA